MGSFMAAALSKLFKENEGIISAAKQVAYASAAGDVTCEKIVSLDLEDGVSLEAGTYSYRIEFMHKEEYEAFRDAMDELHLLVGEEDER
jgi:hypothetical protein